MAKNSSMDHINHIAKKLYEIDCMMGDPSDSEPIHYLDKLAEMPFEMLSNFDKQRYIENAEHTINIFHSFGATIQPKLHSMCPKEAKFVVFASKKNSKDRKVIGWSDNDVFHVAQSAAITTLVLRGDNPEEWEVNVDPITWYGL